MAEMLLGNVNASTDHVMCTGMLENVGVRPMCRNAGGGTMRVHNPSEVLTGNREQAFAAHFSSDPGRQARHLIEQRVRVLDQLLNGQAERFLAGNGPGVSPLTTPFPSRVRNVGRFTPLYMALIDPFRKLIVYPSLLRTIRAQWKETLGIA
jgi:hypothetical protein